MAPRISIAQSALLLIDLQNDVIDPDGAFARGSIDQVAASERHRLLDMWHRLVGFMRDHDRPIIWVTTTLRADAADSALADDWLQSRRAAVGPFLVEGTWGAEIADELPRNPDDYGVVKKGHSAFSDTALDRLLKNLGVTQCIIAGAGVEDAIAETARTGGRLGYEQFVVEDALCPPVAQLRMVRAAAELVRSDDIFDAPLEADSSNEGPAYAMVLVDMQNDFMNNDSAHVRIGLTEPTPDEKRARIIANTQRVMSAVRERGWPVIYVRVVRRGDNLDDVHTRTHRRARTVPAGETHCVEGTLGAEIVAELTPQGGDFMIEKKGGSSFGYTPLHRILRNLKARKLLVTGGAVLGCVWATVQDGLALGYEITVVGDATYPAENSGLEILGQWCPVRATSEIVAELSGITA